MGLFSRRRPRVDETTALSLLRAGRPRRFRAILRILGRQPRMHTPRLLLHEATAHFWEGNFEKARIRASGALASGTGELGALPIALQIQCLLFEDRVADARRLFDGHTAALLRQPAYADIIASGQLLEAMLRFHEGELEGSRAALEALARETAGGRTPASRMITFYLAAAAHKQGRASDARYDLCETIEGGGDLFVSAWAADTHRELFPDDPLPLTTLGEERRRPDRWRSRTLRDLKRGLGILFFRRSALAGATYTFEQTVALLFVDIACAGLLRCVDFHPAALFMEYTAVGVAGALSLFMVIAWLATRGARTSGFAIDVAGAFYSALPLLLVLEFAAVRGLRTSPGLATIAGLLLAGWSLAVVLFIVLKITGGGPVRLLAAAALFAVFGVVPMSTVRRHSLWIDLRPPPSLDNEERDLLRFVFEQADHVHAAEGTLAPERPGVEDLYFVGFAGWGAQDVFVNEVTAARALFDERFDTRGRSLLLANDPSTRRKLPMATKLNLGHVLKVIGERMNPEEDVLFLFLTSHGSQTGLGLESSNHPEMESEESVSPSELRALLEETRIKWRVIVVSGCETGVFIGPLQDEHTLVATASADDRKSFGCENGRQFTEYGRALFAEQLPLERSFETALVKANAVVAEREKERRLTPSLPQLSVGAAIREKLRSLESRVRDTDAGARP